MYDYADEVIDSYIVSKLGRGLYGEVYLLDDDTVVKFTSSLREARCVKRLFELMEEDFSTYQSIFPKIYEYSDIDEVIRFDDSKFFIVTGNAVLPLFWYRREELLDLPISDFPIEYLNVINNKVNESAQLGIELLDYGLGNWGIRPSTGEVIFRDLVCV